MANLDWPAEPEDLVNPRTGKRFKLFEDVEDDVIEALLPDCHIYCFDPDRPVETCECIRVIREGYVAVWSKKKANEGKRWNYFLAWRGPDDILGEMAIVHEDTYPAKITTTDEVEFLTIPKEAFLMAASKSHFLYRNIARLVITKTLDYGRRAEVLHLKAGPKSLVGRVAKTLLTLIENRKEPGNPDTIDGHIRPVDIAGFVAGDQRSVKDQLANLRSENSIAYNEKAYVGGKEVDGKRIRILNLDLLEKHVKAAQPQPKS